MKIRLYIGTRGHAYGGAENTVAVLAAALRQVHTVEIASSLEGFQLARLAQYSGVDLGGVSALHLPLEAAPPAPDRVFSDRRQQRALNARLSQDCDFFLNVGNIFPPFSHAPHAALRIFFPFGITPYTKRATSHGLSRLRFEVKQILRKQEWQQRMATYDFKVVNSQFTQKWTRRYWGVDSQVIYPPVDLDFSPAAEKSNLILSVGRFAMFENMKKQLEMMQTFRGMTAAQSAGWEYVTVGGLVDHADDQAYFSRVVQTGEGVGGRAMANLKRPELKDLLERARIFWHAAGYGEKEDENPAGAEHFGQSTVEAMAAGCVPVVINRGGQPEIVEHGISGFVWETLEELEHFTRRLIDEPALCTRMAAAARARAQTFSRAVFAERFTALLAPLS